MNTIDSLEAWVTFRLDVLKGLNTEALASAHLIREIHVLKTVSQIMSWSELEQQLKELSEV